MMLNDDFVVLTRCSGVSQPPYDAFSCYIDVRSYVISYDVSTEPLRCRRLRNENRRFVQERAENQQMIQLLELQKSILTKTVSVGK